MKDQFERIGTYCEKCCQVICMCGDVPDMEDMKEKLIRPTKENTLNRDEMLSIVAMADRFKVANEIIERLVKWDSEPSPQSESKHFQKYVKLIDDANDYLKTINPYFNEVWEGRKRFEVRNNDRTFKVGDEVYLQEYDHVNNVYLKREVRCNITYILSSFAPIQEGYCKLTF